MTKIETSQFTNILDKFNIKKGSNIYVGVDMIMLVKMLNLKSRNLRLIADLFLKFLLSSVGKSGTVSFGLQRVRPAENSYSRVPTYHAKRVFVLPHTT